MRLQQFRYLRKGVRIRIAPGLHQARRTEVGERPCLRGRTWRIVECQ